MEMPATRPIINDLGGLVAECEPGAEPVEFGRLVLCLAVAHNLPQVRRSLTRREPLGTGAVVPIVEPAHEVKDRGGRGDDHFALLAAAEGDVIHGTLPADAPVLQIRQELRDEASGLCLLGPQEASLSEKV
eukprot:1569851-Rhodomonas_salina.1